MLPVSNTDRFRMDYPKTRKEAQALRATHYFTGSPCSRGHVALRKTKGACVECLREDWVVDNSKRALKPKSEASKAAGRRYYEKNRELVKARSNNRPVEQQRKARETWRKRNPDEARAMSNAWKRRAREAMPAWLSTECRDEIRQLYLRARRLTLETGVKHVVDHIVPLRSSEVCGLHVPWNLQILTHNENCAKSNKLLDFLKG